MLQKKVIRKLNNNNGASLMVALLFFVMCAPQKNMLQILFHRKYQLFLLITTSFLKVVKVYLVSKQDLQGKVADVL